jgi:hypothetical protein
MNAVDLTVQTRTEVAHLAPGALLSGGAGGFRGRNRGYELRDTLPLPAAADWGTSPPSLVRFRQGFVRTYRTPTLRFENLNTTLKDIEPQGISS